MSDSPAVPPAPTFRDALPFWLKLGFVGFGGPAGQIAMMHSELAEKRRWISEQRFLHALNYCMLLPGPEAIQLAIYLSWLLHGTTGAVIAGILFFLPAFLLMTGLAAIAVLSFIGIFFFKIGFPWIVLVAVAAFLALWKYKQDIMRVIGACALLGPILSFVR